MATHALVFDQRVRSLAPVVHTALGRLNDKAKWVVVYDPSATQAQRDAVASWIASVDLDAEVAAATLAELRAAANACFQNGTGAPDKLDRAVAMVLLDEINNLRQWITSFKAAVAAATSFGNLQTRVAALANMPDRTPAQAKTAVTNKLNGGTVD